MNLLWTDWGSDVTRTQAHWLVRDCEDLSRKDISQLSANHRRRHPKLSLSCTSLIGDALVAFRFRSQRWCCIDYAAHDLSAISCALTRGHVADQFLGTVHCETSRLWETVVGINNCRQNSEKQEVDSACDGGSSSQTDAE